MRGHLLSEASEANGKVVDIPANPIGLDKFVGWFYLNENGDETAFDPSAVTVNKPLEVYAKWENNNEKYGIIYHSNGDNDVTYLETNNKSDRTMDIAGIDKVASEVSGFRVPGKDFIKWTTDKEGNNEVKAGDSISIPKGQKTIDIYAQWKEASYKVKFSANGGIFSETSVFKANPDVFDIETDANGGEVAVVKKDAVYKTKLNDLLKGLNAGVTVGSDGISEPNANIASKQYHSIDKTTQSFFGISWDTFKWYADSEGTKQADIGLNTSIESDVTYYLKWKENPNIQSIENEFDLDSDIFGKAQSESSLVGFVKENANEFSLTGAIETSGIKNEMLKIESLFPDAASDYSSIKLSDIKSEFSATLTVPDKVIVPENPKVSLGGFGDAFTLTETKVEGKNITVKFKLKDGIKTYKDLKDAVESTGKYTDGSVENGWMTVKVSGLKLAFDKVLNGEDLTVKGQVTGDFFSYAEDKDGTVKKFKFKWNGKQADKGRDNKSSDTETIQYTLNAVKPYQDNLDGDILIGTDSQHDHIYQADKEDRLDFTGALNVKDIKAQMIAIEKLYPNTNQDAIKVNVDHCTFVAKFTLPDEMEFANPQKVEVENFGNGFEVVDTKIEGKTVTVTMQLKDKDKIDTYLKLKDVVDKAGDADGWMKLTLKGISIKKDKVSAGQRLTVKGSLTGDMSATATSENNNTKEFDFKWIGKQWEDGRDSTSPVGDDTISFTLEIKKDKPMPNPPVPNPEPKPEQPDSKKPQVEEVKKPKTPKTGDNGNIAGWTITSIAAIGGIAISFAFKRRKKS